MNGLMVCSLLSVCFTTSDRSQPPKKIIKIISEEEMIDISGYFTCKGREASGKNYHGMAVIAKKNDVYTVTWVVGGASTFTGIGIRQGNTLAVSWAIPLEKGTIKGVNLYRIDAGPRLTGSWATMPGNGLIQRETLVFLKNLESEED